MPPVGRIGAAGVLGARRLDVVARAVGELLEMRRQTRWVGRKRGGEAALRLGWLLSGRRTDTRRRALRRRGAVLGVEFGLARGVRVHFAI